MSEYVRIRLRTKSRDWTPPQREMMTVARRVHGIRSGAAAMVLMLLLAVGYVGWQVNRAQNLVKQLTKVTDADILRETLNQIDESRFWTSRWLAAEYDGGNHGKLSQRNLRLALLPEQPDLAGLLLEPFMELDETRAAPTPENLTCPV